MAALALVYTDSTNKTYTETYTSVWAYLNRITRLESMGYTVISD